MATMIGCQCRFASNDARQFTSQLPNTVSRERWRLLDCSTRQPCWWKAALASQRGRPFCLVAGVESSASDSQTSCYGTSQPMA
jgi:hypothetical protein